MGIVAVVACLDQRFAVFGGQIGLDGLCWPRAPGNSDDFLQIAAAHRAHSADRRLGSRSASRPVRAAPTRPEEHRIFSQLREKSASTTSRPGQIPRSPAFRSSMCPAEESSLRLPGGPGTISKIMASRLRTRGWALGAGAQVTRRPSTRHRLSSRVFSTVFLRFARGLAQELSGKVR